LVEHLMTVFPEAKRYFGEDLLRAAIRPVRTGGCPWHPAIMSAEVHGRPAPLVTAATMALMSSAPCPACYQMVVNRATREALHRVVHR
jgi:hypothetical protein